MRDGTTIVIGCVAAFCCFAAGLAGCVVGAIATYSSWMLIARKVLDPSF
jgi:hypothetical protein